METDQRIKIALDALKSKRRREILQAREDVNEDVFRFSLEDPLA
jgi:hypothetical protein